MEEGQLWGLGGWVGDGRQAQVLGQPSGPQGPQPSLGCLRGCRPPSSGHCVLRMADVSQVYALSPLDAELERWGTPPAIGLRPPSCLALSWPWLSSPLVVTVLLSSHPGPAEVTWCNGLGRLLSSNLQLTPLARLQISARTWRSCPGPASALWFLYMTVVGRLRSQRENELEYLTNLLELSKTHAQSLR